MRKFRFYLKADLKRLLCSPRPAVSVLLTVAVLLFAVFEGIDLHAGVLYVFSLVMYGMPAMMIFVCAAIAFADSFCEDMEHKYVMQQCLFTSVFLALCRLRKVMFALQNTYQFESITSERFCKVKA